jgi:iron complex outermembrane recepter protein
MRILIPPPRSAAAAILAISASLCAAQSADTSAVELDRVEVSGERPASVATSGALGSRTVLDTPFSLSVIDRAALDQNQSMTLGQAFFGDPSVVAVMNPYSSGWSSPINVRGVELAWDSYRLNGAPTDGWGFEWPLEIMEQVEVLKGSGGFMYGFGSPGGFVNYVTKKPLEKPLLATTVGWRSDTVFSGAIDHGNRVGRDGWFGYRVNLSQEYGGTYNGGDIDRLVGAVALDARVNDHLTLTAEAIHLKRNLENESPYFGFWSYTGATPPKPVSGDTDLGVDGSFWNVEYSAFALGLDLHATPDWTASLDYTYSHKHSETAKSWAYLKDASGDYDLNFYQLGGDTNRNFVQGLIEGEVETGLLGHHAVLGSSFQSTREYGGAMDWNLIGNGNLYTGHAVVGPIPDHSTATSFSGEIRQTALFASDTVEVLPGLSVLGGLRYTDYDDGTYRETPLTPTYAVICKPRAALTLYASYVESLETGGTVGADSGGIPYSNAGQMLQPLVSKQYEVGAKFEDQRWMASVALFRLEQGAEIDRVNSPSSVTRVQDGIYLYEGVDLSLGCKVTPNLTLTGGLVRLDATYDQLSPANAGIEGNRIAGSSEWQAVLGASCKIASLPGLEVHAAVRRFGDFYFNDGNTLKFPAYTLANLGTSYATRLLDHPVILRADVSNLTNEKYWSNAGLGPPVTYALSAQVEW